MPVASQKSCRLGVTVNFKWSHDFVLRMVDVVEKAIIGEGGRDKASPLA